MARRRHRESFGEVGLMVVGYFMAGIMCCGILGTAIWGLARWLSWLGAH